MNGRGLATFFLIVSVLGFVVGGIVSLEALSLLVGAVARQANDAVVLMYLPYAGTVLIGLPPLFAYGVLMLLADIRDRVATPSPSPSATASTQAARSTALAAAAAPATQPAGAIWRGKECPRCGRMAAAEQSRCPHCNEWL